MASKINHYLEEMEHYDKDNRYMGASDLCNLITSEAGILDAERERKCIDAFIRQLDDNSTEVQGKAVQCLAKIASKIREDNLGNILSVVANCIITKDKDFRDIYCICCKSIMAEVTDPYAPTVISSCYPILQNGIKSDDEEVQEECSELLSELLKRFASQIIHDSSLIKEKVILGYLFKILSSKSPYTLKKKVAYAIGCLSVVLSSSNIQALMENLVGSINDNMKDDSLLFYYILALSWVSRKIGYKLGGYLESLIMNLIKICDSLDSENSNDQQNEIAEEALNCFVSLIKHCPREITCYIDKLLKVAQEKMTYDPIYDYDIEDDADMDDEGEAWDDEDEMDDDEIQDDDTSWKVRRGSLNLIISVTTTRPEMLRALYSDVSTKLVTRFKERENKIKSLVFDTFSILLKTTNVESFSKDTLEDLEPSIGQMVKRRSSVEELYSQVPTIVQSLIKETNTKNVAVKISIIECLSQITNALREKLVPFFEDLLPIIKESVIDENNTAIIVPALTSLKSLLQYAKDEGSVKANAGVVLDIILASLKNDHFSVKAEGLLATSCFTKILTGSSDDSVGKLNEVAITCMDASENAIIAVSHLLSSCHSSLTSSEIKNDIDILTEKLSNDMKRVTALKAMHRVCESDCDLSSYSSSFVEAVSPLLSKADNNVKIYSLQVLSGYIGKYGSAIGKAKIADVLTSTLSIITNENLQVADYALKLLCILTSFELIPSALKDTVVKVTSLTESTFLTGKTKRNIIGFFDHLSKNNSSLDFESFITFLEEAVTIKRTVPASCIAIMIHNYSELNTTFTTKYLKGLKSSDTRTVVVSLLILGEIGKLNDLSSVKNIIESVDSLFASPEIDIKQAASQCLGSICIGNFGYFLPKVIKIIVECEEKNKYLRLMSIREIIQTKQQCVGDHSKEISEILYENAAHSEEKIRNVISECLGKLFNLAGLEMMSDLEDKIKSSNHVVRATVAKSFKYCVHKGMDTTALNSFIPDIIELATDSEHVIRQYTLESLVSITHHLPMLLKNDIDTIYKILSNEIEVHKELIKEVDLGPFKHKIDEGRPIRKAGFVLLDTIFEKIPERINVPIINDMILVGLADPDDDCCSQTLHILLKMIKWAPGAVVGQMSNILDKLPKILKEPAKGTTKTSMRIATKVLEKMNEIPEMETNTTFQKFITDNAVCFEETKDE
ncbi:unnamed protein product [Moneuplotes crassus]|uniref:TATA-binding protein interacting (TIP20) domain-containing protein n=1 Tax=Euplotes crassus TaxID=5936 RepID=A0AAD1UNW5_EUPCR|nr:unnamed protein product [Moneuplotes crassus]